MSYRHALTSLAVLATALVAPAVSAAAAPAPAPTSTPASISAYTGSPQDEAATKAFYDAVMKSALAKQAKSGNKLAAVTVVYKVNAPTFRSQITRSAQIWNSSV